MAMGHPMAGKASSDLMAVPLTPIVQQVNTWVQTIGILVASIFATAWGGYTWFYKEVWVPKSAPVNISLSLQLKKIGPGAPDITDEKNQLVAVEMQVSATNPSPRQVYLLPTAWVAFGGVYSASDGIEFSRDAIFALNGGKGTQAQKHASTKEVTIIAAGSLFRDEMLKPNETVVGTRVIYVPSGRYDEIEVSAVVPTTAKKGIALNWKQDEKGKVHATVPTTGKQGIGLLWNLGENGLDPVMYRVSNNNELIEMEKNPDDGYSDPEYELQMASSTSAVSLWQ